MGHRFPEGRGPRTAPFQRGTTMPSLTSPHAGLLALVAALAALAPAARGQYAVGPPNGGGFAPPEDVYDIRLRPRRFRVVIPIIIQSRFEVRRDGFPGFPTPYGGGYGGG